MTLSWTESVAGSFRDAYLDWAEVLRARDPGPGRSIDVARFEPIFVRLMDRKTGPARLMAEVRKPTSPLRMDAHEFAFLKQRSGETDPYAELDDVYALYRAVGTTDATYADLFTVLDTGVPVRITPGADPIEEPPALPQSGKAGAPIVAVIDDAIGFLNTRFCKDEGGRLKSRLHAIWVQALERGDAGCGVSAGRVLVRDEIDAMHDALDEDESYAALYRTLFDDASAEGLWRSTWHGTHVLDLAGGADPLNRCDPAHDWPLLAVQLPPEAIEDTSGMRAESYLVQGLRWVLRSAHQIDPTAPVIVNLSLGIVAGPKDGTRFAEWQVAREAAQWEKATGQKVRIVWAFGNAYRDGLVARLNLDGERKRKDGKSLFWRVQASDNTANHMEIRPHQAPSSAISIAVTSPCGCFSGFEKIGPGEMRSLMLGEAPLARIYHVPEVILSSKDTSPAHYVVVTAPTEQTDPMQPVAPSGAWRVHVRAEGNVDFVSLQIQRDDGLRGNRIRSRQSYFDDADAYAWDAVWQEHSGLEPDGAMRYGGTHSAFASARGRQVLTVGAVRRNAMSASVGIADFRPSDYSAQGDANWCAPGPSLSAVVDGPAFQSGVMGAGRRSGTVRFSNGTSAAAARVSRALGLSAEQIVAAREDGDATDDINRKVLQLLQCDDADVARQGRFVLVTNDQDADRR